MAHVLVMAIGVAFVILVACVAILCVPGPEAVRAPEREVDDEPLAAWPDW